MKNIINFFKTLSTSDRPYLKIAIIYLAISFLWIVYSDKIIFNTFQDVKSIEYYQLIKGTFFVTGTAILIYFLMRRSYKKVANRNLELTASEKKFRALLDNLPIGVYYSTITGEFLYGNKAAEKICGYRAEELIGKNFLKLNLLKYKDILKATELLSLNAMGKTTGPDEFTINRKDGSTIHTEIITHFVKLAEQHVVLGVVKDLTERKLYEELLFQNNKRLEGFLKISQAITTTFDLPVIMQMIVDNATSIMNLDSGAIYLLYGEHIRLSATTPQLPIDFPEKFRTASLVDHYHIRKAITTCQHVIMNDSSITELTQAEQEIVKMRNLQSCLYLPIRLRKKAIGVLILSSFEKEHLFEERDIILLQGFADQAAHIIDNIRNYEEVKKYAQELEKQITERKNAELALQESTARLQSIFKSAPVGIGLLVDRVFLQVNEMFCEITGYTAEEVLGKSARILYPSDEEFEFVGKEKYYQITKKGTGSVETRWVKKDGTIIDILLSSTPIVTNDLSKGVTFTALDITDRKLAESKIRNNEVKFRNLFENHSAIKFIIDPETGKIINANHAAAKFYGYTVNELENMNISQINILSDDEIKIEMDRAKKAQKIYFEFQHKKSDGSISDVEVYSSMIELNGNPYLHSIVHDITKRKKAERELKTSEERLALATKGAGIGIWDYNITNEKLEWDDVMFELFDIDKDNFGGTLNDWKKCLLPDALPEALSKFDEALKEKNEFYIEFPIIKRDGKIYYLVGSGIIKRNESNEVVRVVGINYDITKRKKMENQLRDNEIKYKTVADYNYDWEYWLDTNKKYIYNSPSCERITGYSIDELGDDLTTTINMIHHADKETVYKHYNEELYHRNELENIEFRIITKHGEIKWISHICRKVYDENKNIIGIRGSNRDITEEKKYKIELEKRSLAIEQSPVSIVITNPDGTIEYVNPMFTKVTEYAYDEIIGQNPRILKSGEQSDEFYKNLWSTITAGKTWAGVFHNKKKNGELYWDSSIVSPIKNEEGKITHFIATKEDITEDVTNEAELKKYRENLEDLVKQRTGELDTVNKELKLQLDRSKILEKQLQESLSKEKEINELKTRFIATVSHEFRTPLSALLSSSQMIQRYSKNWSEEKLKQHYNRIESTVKYLTHILDDVLTISRADREILKNNPELCDINELINSFVEDIKPQLTEKHQLILDINCNKDEINIDRNLLRHIIINLLSNAVKYSPNGGKIELTAECSEGQLIISIRDQGLGISEDEIKYIFDPFFRANNSVGIQGTGLGLNIVKRALEILKGEISVESKENVGTTFFVNIPIDNYEQ